MSRGSGPPPPPGVDPPPHVVGGVGVGAPNCPNCPHRSPSGNRVDMRSTGCLSPFSPEWGQGAPKERKSEPRTAKITNK